MAQIGPFRPVSREGVAKSSEKFPKCGAIPANYAFGPFRLDVQGETLFRGTEPVALSHRAVALLRILIDRAGAPVSKDALMEAAWPCLEVEESNLTVQIAALRRVLREEPGGEGWIETLPRRGYRFVGPIIANTEDSLAIERQTRAAPLSERPEDGRGIPMGESNVGHAANDPGSLVEGVDRDLLVASASM